MKTIQDYIVNEGFALAEAIKPPRLSAKNKHLWATKLLDEEEVVEWLKTNCSINYDVVTNDTIKHAVEIVGGRVNIKGDLAIRPFVEEIPFPFGKVDGIFDCEGCDKLKSLKNSPQRVVSYFDCSNCNDLTSLEGAPKEVGQDFYCNNCGKQFTEEDVKKVCHVKGKIYV